MSQSITAKTPAERLFSILLLNQDLKDKYFIKKTLEAETTVINIIHRAEGSGTEEYMSNHQAD